MSRLIWNEVDLVPMSCEDEAHYANNLLLKTIWIQDSWLLKPAVHDPHCFSHSHAGSKLIMKLHHLIDWKTDFHIKHPIK